MFPPETTHTRPKPALDTLTNMTQRARRVLSNRPEGVLLVAPGMCCWRVLVGGRLLVGGWWPGFGVGGAGLVV